MSGLVAITVYCPLTLTCGLGMFAVNPFGPVQVKVAPVVWELAVNVGVGLLQVIVLLVAVTVGGVRFCVTLAVAELTQPLTGFVIVTE